MPLNKKTPPVSKGRYLISDLKTLQNDPLPLFLNSQKEMGDIGRLRFGPRSSYYAVHPDHVKHILINKVENYTKNSRGYKNIRSTFGDGLISSDGRLWQKQRQLAKPEFAQQKLVEMVSPMKEGIHAMIKRWDAYTQRHKTFDVHRELARLAFSLVDKALMGSRLTDEELDILCDSMHIYHPIIYKRTTQIFNLPFFIPSPENVRFNKALKDLKKIAQNIVERHQNDTTKKANIISMILSTKASNKFRFNEGKRICGEILSFLVPGHESTAVLLSWIFYLVSQHPDVEKKLCQEISAVLNGRDPLLEDLPKLQYTEQVFKETMRLYPPVWNIPRRAINADEIGGYNIPAKSYVILSPYVTHRHPDFWKDPEQFKPERFDPDKIDKIHPGAYFPFGLGPRKCVGHQMATIEAKLVISMIMQRYRLQLSPGCSVKIFPLFSLHFKDPLLMTISRRLSKITLPSKQQM